MCGAAPSADMKTLSLRRVSFHHSRAGNESCAPERAFRVGFRYYRMNVIQDPPEGTIVLAEVPAEDSVEGDIEFVCGKCTSMVIPQASMEEVSHMIVKCTVCGTLNQVP